MASKKEAFIEKRYNILQHINLCCGTLVTNRWICGEISAIVVSSKRSIVGESVLLLAGIGISFYKTRQGDGNGQRPTRMNVKATRREPKRMETKQEILTRLDTLVGLFPFNRVQ